MRFVQRNFATIYATQSWRLPIIALLVVFFGLLSSTSLAQHDKGTPVKPSLTGRYEGTAKNKAEEVITVTLELTEKEGTLSGMIRSSHGDFPITGGSHQGETITIQFDADSPGTISLRMTDGKLVGTWNVGDDGGPVDVKKVAAQQESPKGES
jgi:hypothetical protein